MFYEKVKSLCDTNHIAITSLARKLKLSPSAPNNWKEGTLPKAETIMKISEFFDVSTDYLLFGADRYSNLSGTASNGAAILQQSSGNHVAVSSSNSSRGDDVHGFESELLRIYREVDLKSKSELLQFAYTIEERTKNGGTN